MNTNLYVREKEGKGKVVLSEKVIGVVGGKGNAAQHVWNPIAMLVSRWLT